MLNIGFGMIFGVLKGWVCVEMVRFWLMILLFGGNLLSWLT